MEKKREVGGCGWDATAVDRKKIPCVSPGMGEMKCEFREWNRIGEQWRMNVMGNEHKRQLQTVKERQRKNWTRVRSHPVPVPLAKPHP